MDRAVYPAFTEFQFLVTLAALLVAPLALAGVALINTGLGRSRSAAQSILGSVVVIAVAAIGFALVGSTLTGSTLAGSTTNPGHAFVVSGKLWNWIGSGPFFLVGINGALPHAQLELLYEFLALALAVLIPWGSGADRLRLTPAAAIAGVFAMIFFPLLAHWAWAGGWLTALSANFSLGAGFLDPGGAGVVHVLGGLGALSVIWIAGPRKGKFPHGGFATAMPAHNAVFILFGCLLALAGWFGLNIAGEWLWLRAPGNSVPLTAINTLLSASGAVLATTAVTRYRFGKPDASLCANGWLAGLVCSSATAALVSPVAAIACGIVAGIITPLLVELLELALAIDDPSGAIAVHGASGLWGLLAAGFFSSQPGQFSAQLVGIATLLGIFLPLVYFAFLAIDRVIPFRVDPDGERIGMDLHELGGGAYPEFVLHRDDSYR